MLKVDRQVDQRDRRKGSHGIILHRRLQTISSAPVSCACGRTPPGCSRMHLVSSEWLVQGPRALAASGSSVPSKP